MKVIAFLALAMSLSISVSVSVSVLAQQSPIQIKTRILKSIATNVRVDLNSATVKCSSKGYMLPELKVLVPALAKLTVLDHRNVGEGAPCITAGMCDAHLNPQNFLSRGSGIEAAPVLVKVIEDFRIDHAQRTCAVLLKEEIFSKMHDIVFHHLRTQSLGNRTYEDCLN